MSKKENNSENSNTNKPGSNDLEILRTILVNEPVSILESKLSKLEDKLMEVSAKLEADTNALRKDMETRTQKMEKDYANRVDGLESQIYVKIENLQKELASFSAAEKNRIGHYLAEIGNSLINNG